MKITLCGSTRFHERFQELNEKLSAQGHVVYSVAFAKIPGTRQPTPEEKITLDLVHLKKILDSDAVVLIGHQPDNTYYIGESTRRELEWAMLNEKNLYLEKVWSHYSNGITSVETTYALENPMSKMLEKIQHACDMPKMMQEGGEA
jgi:hypothetical protein